MCGGCHFIRLNSCESDGIVFILLLFCAKKQQQQKGKLLIQLLAFTGPFVKTFIAKRC